MSFRYPASTTSSASANAASSSRRVAGIVQHDGGDARPPRPLEGARVGLVGDDAGDAGRRAGTAGVEQCLQVRAAARGEHGDANRGH